MRRFLSAVFTQNVINVTAFLLGVVGVLLALFLKPNADTEWKLAWTTMVVLFDLVILFAFAAYRFYRQFSAKLRVIRQVQQVGSSDQADYIVVFENPEFIREGSIVSLVSPMSGADQTVALLQVTRSERSEPLQAKAFPPGEVLIDIGSLIPQDGSTRLFVTPMVHASSLSTVFRRPISTRIFREYLAQLSDFTRESQTVAEEPSND